MKKLVLIIMLVPLLGISQQQFKITPKGLNTNSIVIEIDSLNASQLYYKTINLTNISSITGSKEKPSQHSLLQ